MEERVGFLNRLEISFIINFNPIRNIREHTFRNHGVEDIDLSFNKITTIKNKAFVNLTKLEKTCLNQNLTQRLEFGILNNISNFKTKDNFVKR
jgi:hypothetical protein